jgi:hypothetical protein
MRRSTIKTSTFGVLQKFFYTEARQGRTEL